VANISLELFDGFLDVCFPISAGELKEKKAYKKWAKKISETKPPTSPLRRAK
jgi:hypothetical protein